MLSHLSALSGLRFSGSSRSWPTDRTVTSTRDRIVLAPCVTLNAVRIFVEMKAYTRDDLELGALQNDNYVVIRKSRRFAESPPFSPEFSELLKARHRSASRVGADSRRPT